MNVLLSSSGNKVPLLLALKDAVSRLRIGGTVTAGDINNQVLTSYFCDAFWEMPATIDANRSQIITELKKHQITHVLPTRDGELLFWANMKPLLQSEGIDVIVASEPAITRCLDKLKFSQHDAPNIISSCTDLSAFGQQSESPRYVVKERFGSGSASVGINLSASDALTHASTLSSPIFQPYIDGQEISIDAWLTQEYQLKAAMCRVRALVINGESQVTYTLPDSPFLPQIERILSSLKLSGPVVLQAIIRQGKLHIIECNTRFGGASTLGIKAGVDSLFWSLSESLGEDVNALPVSLCEQTIRQIRAATDFYL